jgi:hypothetical protein
VLFINILKWIFFQGKYLKPLGIRDKKRPMTDYDWAMGIKQCNYISNEKLNQQKNHKALLFTKGQMY